jgi:hypothetical protein
MFNAQCPENHGHDRRDLPRPPWQPW